MDLDGSDDVSDPMNLDDFIIPSSVGSPTGFSPPGPTGDDTSSSNHAVASAIPIKNIKEQDQTPAGIVMPASFPYPSQEQRRNNEFGYVQRRVRKTSVDERIVSLFPHPIYPLLITIIIIIIITIIVSNDERRLIPF